MFRESNPSALRVLSFDLENRPLSYLGGDGWTSAEITAIAWSWVDSDAVDTLLLRKDGRYVAASGKSFTPPQALELFVAELYSADIVTCHYGRKHDLPILNGALLENGLPPLRSLLVQDTHSDLVRRKDISASLENLASMLEIPGAKVHMTQSEWRAANRLLPEGLELGRKRVTGDVILHKALRAELIKRQLLRAPRRWSS